MYVYILYLYIYYILYVYYVDTTFEVGIVSLYLVFLYYYI